MLFTLFQIRGERKDSSNMPGRWIQKPDPEIRMEQVLGKVVAARRNGTIIHFDTARNRLIGLSLVKTSRLRPWFYPFLTKFRKINKSFLSTE